MKEDVSALRLQINELDKALIEILSKRKDAIKQIGEIKKVEGVPALDTKRWQEVLDSRLAWAKEFGVEEEVVKDIFENIHDWSLGIQNKK